MKKHAIIPIFIPHRGCPNDCVFCNQHSITARADDVTPEDARATIETWLTTLRPGQPYGICGGERSAGAIKVRSERRKEHEELEAKCTPEEDESRRTGSRPGAEIVEIAFYGGSFTGLPMDEQSAFLEIAKEYKDRGMVDKIHLSTRPDYIDREILDNLKKYGVDIIELGVQSFDDEVLRLSNRGHDRRAVDDAVALIREYGFEFGIQLMIGLPGDSYESCVMSARETAALRPALARLYPTVVLDDTELLEMYRRGEYAPLGQAEAVSRTLAMYKILVGAGITVMRIGLKSTDLINNSPAHDRERGESMLTGTDIINNASAHDRERGESMLKSTYLVSNSSHSAGDEDANFNSKLNSSDAKDIKSAVSAGTYHPAFRQLVEGAYAREVIENLIIGKLGELADPAPKCGSAQERGVSERKAPGTDPSTTDCLRSLTIYSNSKWFSNMIGHNAENKKYFSKKYHDIHIKYTVNNDLPDMEFVVK